MFKRLRRRAKTLLKPLFALIMGGFIIPEAPAVQAGDPPNYPVEPKPKPKGIKGLLSHRQPTVGTLGYGPPGPQPGFQGFGLRFGRNYGFGGGNALGVGAEGGYPFFGGPGYPHPSPVLNRFTGITAFPYFGGPGGPTASCPNFYGEPGSLVYDIPVVRYEGDSTDNAGANDFGAFSGMVPYPEQAFAPFSTEGGKADKDAKSDPIGEYQTPTLPPPPNPDDMAPAPPTPPTGAALSPLGIEAEPVAGYGSTPGLKVTRVLPGKAAERSGLAVGDVIRSANGYVTASTGNLEWIMSNTTPGKPLNLSVRALQDGSVRAVSLTR